MVLRLGRPWAAAVAACCPRLHAATAPGELTLAPAWATLHGSRPHSARPVTACTAHHFVLDVRGLLPNSGSLCAVPAP